MNQYMKRNLLKSLFLGLSILFLAQFSYAQLNVTPVSGPNLCDGTAALSNPSSVIQSSITWYGNGAIIATNTYQIGNLCPGIMVFHTFKVIRLEVLIP